jgi:hypothetical protein
MAQTNYRTAFGSYTQLERIGGRRSGEVLRVTDGEGKAYGLKLLRPAVAHHQKKRSLNNV